MFEHIIQHYAMVQGCPIWQHGIALLSDDGPERLVTARAGKMIGFGFPRLTSLCSLAKPAMVLRSWLRCETRVPHRPRRAAKWLAKK